MNRHVSHLKHLLPDRHIMRRFCVLLVVAALTCSSLVTAGQPNVVVILTDDQGYGDLGCYGHPTIRTPNIDRMASEGMKFTNFYAAAAVCTPSRAALLTGRLPLRSGMTSDTHRVLFPDSLGGLPASEVTLAELLREKGYATACVGKWHLGHRPGYLPTNHGFDSFFGLPYVNDMDRVPDKGPKGRAAFFDPKIEYWNVPLLRGDQIVERPADQRTLTQRYTEEAVRFVSANRGRPFFLYLAYAMPHVPLFASEAFAGKSARGVYGDTIEEIDWGVGEVLKAIRAADIEKTTWVTYTSDNGPWHTVFHTHGGSAGPLREGKGSTWEGGMRVPGIMRWPGTVPAGVTNLDMVCAMDLYVTAARLAGATVPADRPIDGLDISATMTGKGPSPRDEMVFYRDATFYAIRQGPWKAHFITRPGYGPDPPVKHDPPLLFHLGRDPGEQYDLAKDHPNVVARLRKLADEHKAGMVPGEPQLEARTAAKKK